MKTFNLNLNLFLFSIFGASLSLISEVFSTKLGTLNKIPIFFENLHEAIVALTASLILWLIISVSFEIISRLTQDSSLNYFKSVIEAFKLRRFTTQSERTEKIVTDSQQKITVNPTYHDFNRAVRKSVIDITKNQVLVFVKVPHSQQAHKIFKDMENLLREEISSRNPDYIFSNPQPIKNQFWFTGTKR